MKYLARSLLRDGKSTPNLLIKKNGFGVLLVWFLGIKEIDHTAFVYISN